MARVSKSMSADNSGGADDRRQALQRTVEPPVVRDSPANAVLPVQGEQAQRPGRTVGLQVGSGDQAVAEQEGQHVVAVAPLVRALVDLDQVAEPEHPLGEWAVPEQVVE